MDEQLVQKIVDAVDEDRVVEFARSLVRIPSFATEETPLAKHIVQYLKGISSAIEAELQEVPAGDGQVSHNAVARLRGSDGGPTLLLYGHMDHGPILGRQYFKTEGFKFDPFAAEVEDGWMYGEGAVQGKGGISSMVMAAEAVVKAGVKLKGDVIFAPLAVHFLRSAGMVQLLKEGIAADYVISTGECGNMIVPVFVGRAEGKIHIQAPDLHSHTKETFPQLRNRRTTFELMNEIQRALGPEMQSPGPDSWMTFEPYPDLPGFPQMRMERVEFHGRDHLALQFQIRTVPGMSDETIRQDLRRLLDGVEERYPYLRTEVEWPVWESRPPAVTPKDSRVVQSLSRWHERVRQEPAEVGSLGLLGGSSDGSHTAALGMDTVLYGPAGGETDKEYRLKGYLGEGPRDQRTAVKDLVATARVYALTIADICG